MCAWKFQRLRCNDLLKLTAMAVKKRGKACKYKGETMKTKTYQLRLCCKNCGYEAVVDIQCGKTKQNAEKEMACPVCDCSSVYLCPVDSFIRIVF